MPQLALRETMRIEHGRLPLLDRHLMRLSAGGCDSAMLDRAQREAIRAAADWPEEYGKMTLVVTPSGAVMVDVTAEPSAIDVPGNPVPVLVECEVPTLPPGCAKPADRSFWDVPLNAAREQGGDIAVLVSPDGHLMDASSATVWVRAGDEVRTPKSPPALAGVSRGIVLDCASELGFSAREADLTPEDFEVADEVFFTTAVHGCAPARGRGGWACSAVTALFRDLFAV